MELDKDDNLDGLDSIPQPPKTVDSLKLYGRAQKLLIWIEDLNLIKLKLDLTVVNTEELQGFRPSHALHHLCVRPIQGGKLGIGWMLFPRVIEIHCSGVLDFKCDSYLEGHRHTEVLKVHFSRESSLHIYGLDYLDRLEEVWLKGYSDEHRQDIPAAD